MNEKKDEESVRQEQQNSLEVPDGGYGWVVVAACALFNVSTWGSNAGYAIYLAHYISDNTFPGATKIDYGIVGGAVFGCGLPFAIFYNYLVGKLGLKPVIATGIAVQFTGTLLASFATKYWQILLTQGVLQGIGMAMVAQTNINLMPQWFRRKRSTAIGLSAAGSGLGGVIFNLPMQQILKQHSFRWSLRTQAIMCAVLSSIALVLAKSREKHIKPVYKIYDKAVWLCFGVWAEVLYLMLTVLGYVVLMYNLADFTRSLGYSAMDGSIVSMMVSLGGLLLRPICGRMCDRWGPINVSIFVHLLVALFALAMWIPLRTLAAAIVFAFIEGGLMGTLWICMPPITARIVGLRKLGLGMAFIWIFIGISGFVSPIIGIDLKAGAEGQSYPEQYRNPAIFVGCVYIGSAAVLLVMRGWVVARSLISFDKFGHIDEDADILAIRVPPQATLQHLFTPHGRI